jgi:hypothetical protein
MRKYITALAVLLMAVVAKASPVASSVCASGCCPLCK